MNSMNRRYFLKTASVLTFASGSAFLLMSYAGRLFNGRFLSKLPSPYTDDSEVQDKVAFTEAVYPFFSREEFFNDVKVILSKKKEWSIIKQTFFKYYYSEKKSWYSDLSILSALRPKKVERFAALPRSERELAIVEYIRFAEKENVDTDTDALHAFDTARNGLVNYLIRHSYSPFSAYGYPDKRSLPFMADPSWVEYHEKPGGIAGFN